MSNFSETYFYSSVLDNGKLNEYGCGVKNVNDSKEYYIYDSDSKNYITVDKEKYLDYNEKMEKLEHTPKKQQQQFNKTDTQQQFKQQCPFTQKSSSQQQFNKTDTQCPLTRQQCPFAQKSSSQQQFKQRPVQPSSPSFWDDCQQFSQSPSFWNECCQQSPPSSPRPLYQYPLGGYVKRIPVMNEVDVLKRENHKLKSMLKYYTSY